MDEFIDLSKNLLGKLFDCLHSSQKLSDEDITDKIKSILNEHIRNIKPNSMITTNGLEGQSHIYSFLLNCFVDLELISSSKFDAINNQLPEIKMKKLLTIDVLSELYQNLKCCEESISIFQLFSPSRHHGGGGAVDLNQTKIFLNKYPEYKNKFGIYGTTILYAAIEYGNLEIIKYLIETIKCELNLQNHQLILPNGKELLSNGNTPLHAACHFQYLEIVKYLLKYQTIDLNLKNSSGQTPQTIAESNKNCLILLELEQFSKMSKEYRTTTVAPAIAVNTTNDSLFLLESQKKEVSNLESNEMFYIILNQSSHLDAEYKEIITKFILKDGVSIEEVIKQNFPDVENEKQILVGISNIEQQRWITFAIVKVSQNILVYFVKDEFSSSSSLRSYESKKNQIMKIIEEKFKNNFSFQVIKNGNREENDEISHNFGFALALDKMKIIIEFLQGKKIEKKFEEINFSTHLDDNNKNRRREILFNFEKSFVEQGLNETDIGKETLAKILVALKNAMEIDKKYLLGENQLIQLTNFLTKKNFLRLNDDETDLKEIIIKILLELKNRGQVINNRFVEKNLQNYYEKNKSYLDKIEEFDKILHRDFRDNEIKGCLILALNDQKEFLFSIEKLIPNLTYFDKFIHLLDDHSQKRQELEMEKTKLNMKSKILKEENNQKGVKQREELIEISFKISKIQEQLGYYLAKSEISKSVNTDDLIVLLGENLTAEYEFSQGTINKVIEVGKRTEENEELALALIKILNFNKTKKISLDKDRNRKEIEQIEQVFNKLLSQISQSEKNVKIIVNLREEFLILLNQNSNLFKFLYHILIEDENLTNRTKALKILKLSKFYPNNLEYIERTVRLEEKCSGNDSTIVQDCLTEIKSGNKLTLNSFQKLVECFSTHIEMIREIIKEIVEQDIQKLPEFFILRFKEHMTSSLPTSASVGKENRTKNMISICKSLIKGKYLIDLNEIRPNIGDSLLIDDDEYLRDDILEMILTKFTNGDKTEKEITDKIKLLAVKNEYAENIIKFIDNSSMDDDIAVLKNLKIDLTERKQALDKVVRPSIVTINILEYLIRYDPDLRADSFKSLIRILPDDYDQKKGFEINLNVVGEAIYDDENIRIEDISKLVHKNKGRGDLLAILPTIVRRIRDDQLVVALNLLNEISCFKQLQGNEFVLYLLNFAASTTKNQIRAQIITIIENCIKNNKDLLNIKIRKQKVDSDGTVKEIQSLLVDDLKQLKVILLIDKDTLESLRKNIQQGNVTVTEDEIVLLIEALVHPKEKEKVLDHQITDVLLEIDLRQGFSDKITARLCEEIIKDPKFVRFSNLVRIIATGLSRRREIPNQVIDTLWEQFLSLPGDLSNKSEMSLKYNLIYAIMILVRQNQQIPNNVLEELANLLTNQKDDIQVRIAIAKILSKRIRTSCEQKVPPVVIQSLKSVALQPRYNENEDLLNKYVFRSLNANVDTIFLINFYHEFRKRAAAAIEDNLSDKEGLERLDKFIQEEENNFKTFQLLNALNIQFSNYEKIDTTILTQFDQNEWTREILACQLLVGIFKIKRNSDEGVNEFELDKFRENIQLITTQMNYPIEDLLEILIEKQNIYEFNLQKLNDIFFILISQESDDNDEKNKVLDILQSDYADFYIQLQKVWLAKRLKCFQIEFTDENLIELNQYLPYRPETIKFIFDQTNELPKKMASIDELIQFFIILQNSGLSQESRQLFLANELVEKTTLTKLISKLCEKLIGQILSEKLSPYENFLKSKKNYKNYNFLSNATTNVRLRKNAYNQAHTMEWYTAEDIAQISSQWMKEFFSTPATSKQYRITQALGQQDNRSLAMILNDVLNEYKQEENRTFIIPLNIAGNHWVTVALVHDQDKNVLLYKDSLGEENDIEEREEVERIFKAAELTNFEFKFNRSCEQVDGYNCGIFAVANMKIIAEQLTSSKDRKNFIENFENYKKFVNQKQVGYLRKEIFPKMYALSLCEPLKRRKIVDHHSPELKYLEDFLQKNGIFAPTTTGENNRLRLSIGLPQEENLLKNDYKYLYVIEIIGERAGENFLDVHGTEMSVLKTKLIQALSITGRYSEGKRIIKIPDGNLTALIQKQKKLDPTQITIDKLLSGDNEIDELLGQLDVDVTEFNKEILRDNLGLVEGKGATVSAPASVNDKNEIINSKDCELVYELHQKLTKILTSAGWFLESIVQLLSHVDSKMKLEHLSNSLDPVYEYNLTEYDQNMKGKNLFQILLTTSSQNWATEIHNLAIFRTFKGSHVKDLNQLKGEIFSEELNKHHNLPFCQDETLIIEEYENVKIFYEREKSDICPELGVIKEWKTHEISQWAEKLKLNRNGASRYEIIAIMKRAVEITSEFPPREIQLLSVLILMNPKNKLGRLAQINTGEGKTTIVAMLAAIKALEGHQVDIVTSSPELAKPQSENQNIFFQLFGLTCAHNGHDPEIDIKQRYQADIVYGAASDFQGDILRDEYGKLNLRQGRKCDVAIVDEVDSMLIDGKNHIVMLSTPMPAMDHLEPLLAAIWIQIGEVAKSIKEINGKWYFIEQENVLDENGKTRSDIVEHAYCIIGAKEKFIKDCTEKHIRKLIRDEKNLSANDKENLDKYPDIKIPKHLRELVIESQLKKWIDSAIHARYKCKKEQDYIIKNGKILPVDASNTGIVQQNMNWNDGLHQFLQIKHGAKITPESLTTNFISNVTYFQRYSPNIFGLSGTLGSNNARKLLNETYEVDSVIIPPFKQKQYKELSPIICDQEDDWYMNIVQSSINKLNNGRAVLVITKYIQQVEEIRNRLIDAGYNKEKIKMYKTEEDSTKAIKQELKHGEIVIATNIAGRGTDIRAGDKIENNGGLHVCVTFLPPNERVEQQNVGRTSRTGNKGTGQFILLAKKSNDEFSKLKATRDEEEETGLQSAKTEIDRVTIKDEIFVLFCKLLNDIDDENILPNQSNKNPDSKIKLRAVEERFSIWLKMEEATASTIDGKQTKKGEMKKNFEIFKKQILDDKENDRLIQNPYFHVLIGNEFLGRKRTRQNDQAIEEFTKAIEMDEYFQANAFYNRGYARIAQYGNNIQHEQIDKAIDDFKKAKIIIEENFEPMLNIIQQASTHSEALSEQVAHKMTLYGVQKNTIEMAVGQDITSQIKALEKEKQERKDATERRRKEIDEQLKELNGKTIIKGEQINELEREKKEQDVLVDREKAIDEQIKNLKENQQARELGIIGQAKNSKRSIEIEHVEIEKSLPEDEDVNLYKDEIKEYKNNGFRGSFKIKEVIPIDWQAVLAVAALGIAQLVGGAALAVFTLGAGASIGMGLMFEGVSDLITAVKDGIINRDFSWVSYGIQKAISLTVSLVCAGMGAIKDAAKTAVAGIKQAASVVTKTVVTTVTKTGWKIAAKAMGTAIAKGVAKELVTQLVDYGVNKALIPSIEEEIVKLVEQPIQDALMNNSHVEKMLNLDGINRNNKYEMLIKNKVLELLNPQQQGGSNALATIAKGIVKGIASNKIPGLSTITQITEAVEALATLKSFVPQFLEKLNQAIEKIFEEEGVQEILDEFEEEKQQVTNTKQKKQQDSKGKKEEKHNENNFITTTSNYDERRKEDDIDISQSSEHEQQVELNRETKSPDELRRILATSVSTNMCNIIKSKLITPVTRIGTNYGMKHLTAGLDKNVQEEIGIFQAERRIEFSQDGDRDNRIPEEYKKGMKDPEAVEKADAMIDDLKNGGEAGLPHLGSLSDAAGRPIKVLDEKGRLIRIIGEHKGGTPVEVEYHKPTTDNPQGHWTLPGGKEPAANNTGKNNCLFNAIAEQTGKDPNQLRADTATRMEYTKVILANQAHDIKRLEKYKKDALTMGGVEKRVRLNPSELRFSQTGISCKTRDGTLIEQLAENINKDGFKDNCPINAVRMQDGILTALDNRRVAATDAAEVLIIADIYEHDEKLPKDLQERYKVETAQDAVLKRMENKDPTKYGYAQHEVKVRGKGFSVAHFVKITRGTFQTKSNQL